MGVNPRSWWERIPVPPPTLAGVAGAVILGRGHDVGRLPRWARPVGWAVAAVGLVVVVGAVRDRGPGPLDEPAELVTTGMHARSRHPMYVGVTLLQLGGAGILRSPWMLASCLVSSLGLHRAAMREERWLRSRFGAQYDAYAARVPRYR